MNDLQFSQIQKELNNLALRLVHMESTQIEKADEIVEVLSSLVNELRDLKAELIAVADLLVNAMPVGKG